MKIRFLEAIRDKVNSVLEACNKCFAAVNLLKFEILQNTWKNKAKNIKMLNSGKRQKTKGLIFFIFSCDLQDFKF